MAITTEDTYLIYKNTSTWEKLVDIKDFPDLGSAPSTVDVTTLSNHMKVYLNGLVDPGALEFTANYDKTDYEKLFALAGSEKEYGIQFGKTGTDGVFTFKGELSVWVKGGSVEAAVDMGISIASATEIKLDGTASVTIS